jgi:putative flippase GtrA
VPNQNPKNSFKDNAVQFLKYLTGGSVYFWSGYAVFAVCYSVFGWHWFWAKVAADTIGWSLNYLIQRYWAFAGQHHLREIEHLGRYVFISVVGLLLDYLIIGALNAIGVTPYIGFFIAAAFFTAWNFLWYKYWVFPKKSMA